MRKFKNNSNISGHIIENARLSKNLSREDLSNKLQLMGISVDRSFVYRIERQTSILKDFELLAICEVLEINMNELKQIILKK